VDLTSRTRLGPYEIISAIGAGGMGEVYRARDTKLNREVALKVLPDAFTRDPDRLARFKREGHLTGRRRRSVNCETVDRELRYTEMQNALSRTLRTTWLGSDGERETLSEPFRIQGGSE